jgi:hypothetical protein
MPQSRSSSHIQIAAEPKLLDHNHRRETMKTRLGFVAGLALMLTIAFVPAAEAKTIKLFVTPVISAQDDCRVATDQIKWSYAFKAKIERKNSPLPRNVIIRYKVLDTATGAQIGGQKVTLKPKKFFKVGALYQYAAGQSITIVLDASFKSPTTGKTFKSHSELPDTAPTIEQMDAAGANLPTCVA